MLLLNQRPTCTLHQELRGRDSLGCVGLRASLAARGRTMRHLILPCRPGHQVLHFCPGSVFPGRVTARAEARARARRCSDLQVELYENLSCRGNAGVRVPGPGSWLSDHPRSGAYPGGAYIWWTVRRRPPALGPAASESVFLRRKQRVISPSWTLGFVVPSIGQQELGFRVIPAAHIRPAESSNRSVQAQCGS